jgi:hypothetical protein
MRYDIRSDFFAGFVTIATLVGPGPSRMQDVPTRALLFIPSLAGIVIPESIHEFVPERTEPGNEECLRQWDPDVLSNEKSAPKVLDR